MEYMIYAIPGLIFVIEIALIALLISLIGAAIYVFFISSMKNDRNEQRIKIYANRVSSEYGFGDGSSPNPWDTITGKGADDKSTAVFRKSFPDCDTTDSARGIL